MDDKKTINNALVKYSNRLNNLGLKDFKATELDLLMTLLSKARDRKDNRIVLSFDSIKQGAGYLPTSTDRFIKDLLSTNNKLQGLKMSYENENKIVQFVLFPTFAIDRDAATLEVEVNSHFAYLINDLTSFYTKFELEEFTGLKSVYSKNLYRLLKGFRLKGEYSIDLDRFREYMDIPEAYTPSKIDEKVLKPAMKELSQIFMNLAVTKRYAKQGGKGRPSLSGYQFTFDPEARYIGEMGLRESGLVCPECGEMLYEKVINGKNCWVHVDGHLPGAKCSKIYNSVADIYGLSETPLRNDDERTGSTAGIGDILKSLL